MATLVYKTIGDSSLQGKAKVYFCAHPRDFARFLDELTEDIFKTQNCVVCHKDEPMGVLTEETCELELKKVQLFVVPITSAFLNEDGVHRREYEFAVESRIPVLPIFMENGLEDKFNELCDGRQALYKYGENLTAQTYGEKLAAFLSSVLVGDELREKIRSEFDAYIFLSYCKEDKKYAQELMKLIHANEFCRDIAIWYDEFLTLGENFYGEIEGMLKKSDLIAFVVTPTLAEGMNYVARSEYPMAKKEGKKMLPAELLQTDRKKLDLNFKEFPDVLNAYDAPALSSALQNWVRELGDPANDGSVEHNYLIALAYLAGVDVEIDYERAAAMIKECAEEGYDKAIEKLVSMYRKGEGLKRNPLKAAEWQRKLVKKRLQEYQEANDIASREEKLIAYSEAVTVLAECVLETNQTRQLRTAKKLYRDLFAEIRCFLQKAESVRLQRALIVASMTIGDLLVAERTRKETAALMTTAAMFDFSSEMMDFRAQTLRMNDKTDEQVRALYEECLEDAETLAQSTGERVDKQNVFIIYLRLCHFVKDTEKRMMYAIKSLEGAETLWKETGDVVYLTQISDAYMGLAAVEEAGSPLYLQYVGKSIEYAERVVQERDDVNIRRALCTRYWLLILYSEGEEQLSYLFRTLECALPLWERTGKNDDLLSLASTYLTLSSVELLTIEERVEYLKKALKGYEKLSELDPYNYFYTASIEQIHSLLSNLV